MVEEDNITESFSEINLDSPLQNYINSSISKPEAKKPPLH